MNVPPSSIAKVDRTDYTEAQPGGTIEEGLSLKKARRPLTSCALLVAVVSTSAALTETSITEDSVITRLAGTGEAGSAGDGGPATAAQLYQPRDSDTGADGTILVADTFNHRVRKIAHDGKISTVAGIGIGGYGGDGGPATQAMLKWPHDVVFHATMGTVILADSNNHRVRQITADGIISTIAGTGRKGFAGDGGSAVLAQLSHPKGLALFGDLLYVSDAGNHRIRRINLATGIIETVAGNGSYGYSGDGGEATSAQLHRPQRIDVDAQGNLYIADTLNHAIRRVSVGGLIDTVAGTGSAGFSGDGGPATEAMLRYPRGVAVAGSHSLFVGDSNNHRVRRVDLVTGVISTTTGTGQRGLTGDGGPGGDAKLYNPRGVSVDDTGRLLIADTLNNVMRVVTP